MTEMMTPEDKAQFVWNHIDKVKLDLFLLIDSVFKIEETMSSAEFTESYLETLSCAKSLMDSLQTDFRNYYATK